MEKKNISIGFAIDKPQTFQIIESLLRESISRGYPCTVYSCFDITSTLEEKDRRAVRSIVITDKNILISTVSNCFQDFDVFIGINVFNSGWGKLYSKDATNLFGVEYCWNEIYNTGISVVAQDLDFKTDTRLFCNSLQTDMMIAENRKSRKNLLSLGSPWFESLIAKKINNKEKKVVFLAPHNSMYRFDKNLKNKVVNFIENLKKICDERGLSLVLKDRRKYSNRYSSTIAWDNIVYDDRPHDHINCYKDASLTISFCSSGINEFTFLEVPYLCACPEYQQNLNPQIHEIYYSGDIFDDVHSSELSSIEITNYSKLSKTIDSLLSSSKNWKDFQHKHFTGNHRGASSRVLDFIESEIETNN